MNEEKKESNQKRETGDSKSKKAAVISILATLAVVLVIFGAYWAWQKYSASQKDLAALKQQMENLQKGPETVGETTVTEEAGETGTPATETGTDTGEYSGWKTYTNSEIGYTLKYPADWTLKEIDQFSELLDTTVKYITITTPGKKYFLQWGLKQKTDAFAISDRSGIGAGDFQKDGKVMILGKEYDITRFVFKGKTKEVFYPTSGLAQTADGKYDFVATLSYGSGSSYDALDIDNVSEKALAEKILKSVSLTGKTTSSAGCAQSFTNEEKLDKADWKTVSNAKNGYSLKYPKDWSITTKQNDYLNMGNAANNEYFEWRSGPMAGTDYMGYKEDSHKNISVGCQNAKITYFSGDPTADPPGDAKDRLILVQFEKNGIPHVIIFTYKYFGASVSSDIVQMFQLILKTAEFSK